MSSCCTCYSFDSYPAVSSPANPLAISLSKSDIFWSDYTDLSDVTYPEFTVQPFIVLMESTDAGRNIRKLDPLRFAHRPDYS